MPRPRTEPAVADIAADAGTLTTEELLELANAASPRGEITARTLRYYASLQLIDPPVSRQGQPARYTHRHLEQLAAVRRRRDAGRGLAEIAAEIAAGVTAGETESAGARSMPSTMSLPAPLPMPGRQPHPTTGEAARSVVIAPGVQLVLTGPALADPDLVARLTAAAHDHSGPQRHVPRTAHTPRKTGAH